MKSVTKKSVKKSTKDPKDGTRADKMEDMMKYKKMGSKKMKFSKR